MYDYVTTMQLVMLVQCPECSLTARSVVLLANRS